MQPIKLLKSDFCEEDPIQYIFDANRNEKISLFGRPIEVGHYSIDHNREIHFDKRNLRYLISPLKTQELNMNLNLNFSTDAKHDYITLEKMHQILYWLKYNKPSICKHKFKMKDIDFVTFRGCLRRILCAPFIKGFHRDHWVLCASKYDGVIYLTAIDSDADIRKDENKTLWQLQRECWGYKFEQYITTDKIGGICDISSNVHQLEEYCVVLKNALNNHKLLYGAEIDAVRPHSQPQISGTSQYIELKTNRIMQSEIEHSGFCSNKLLAWWSQSLVAGISDILCGFRDDEGVVKYIKNIKVDSIPSQVQELWNSETCLNFCDAFLNYVKKNVVEDNPRVVYKFTLQNRTISCTKLVKPESRYNVIPDWYVTP